MGLVLLSYGNFVCFVLLNSFRMAVNLKIALIVRPLARQLSVFSPLLLPTLRNFSRFSRYPPFAKCSFILESSLLLKRFQLTVFRLKSVSAPLGTFDSYVLCALFCFKLLLTGLLVVKRTYNVHGERIYVSERTHFPKNWISLFRNTII